MEDSKVLRLKTIPVPHQSGRILRVHKTYLTIAIEPEDGKKKYIFRFNINHSIDFKVGDRVTFEPILGEASNQYIECHKVEKEC